MIEFKYRPDIDGLRAVAVLMVLLFHADFGFSGGYVGVDVFFVVSGFLITGLILKEQRSGTFSLAGFWERRIRRIVPAATCLVAAVLMAGPLLLLPHDLEELAESTIAQQLMLANVYFWRTGGYFGGAAEFKPLLHTWSLAVEEQFYLGLPFLLLVCKGLQKGRLVLLLCGLGLISFAVSVWGTYSHPTATFYLLPTRAWELLAGSILVFCPAPSRFRPWQVDLIAWLGLGGILFAALWYDSSTRFPGPAALLPCLGTVLVIYSNSFRTATVARILSTKALVTLGLMSYSLYLWHWPILVYQRYWLGGVLWNWLITPYRNYWLAEVLGVSSRIAALLLSVLIAYVSWKYVERPFRKGGSFHSGKTVVSLTFSSSLCLVLFSLWVDNARGLPSRIPDRVLPYAARNAVPERFVGNTALAQRGDLPQLGTSSHPSEPIAFLVWGDSHALAIAELCHTLAREHNIRGAIAARGATVPLLGTWCSHNGPQAVEWNQAVLQFVKSRRISNVVLVSRWAVYIGGESSGERTDLLIRDEQSSRVCPEESMAVLRRGFERTVAALAADGTNVWIMKQVPMQATDPTRSLFLAAYLERRLSMGVTSETHARQQSGVSRILDASRSSGLQVLDPADCCFDSSGHSRIGDAEGSFYVDDDHISKRGAEILLRPLLEPVFMRIAAHNQQSNVQVARRNPHAASKERSRWETSSLDPLREQGHSPADARTVGGKRRASRPGL